ncbi:hypothetical protein B0H14DRAFT_2646804 [Mycena olivaceomarginata]|nr:hypothetical protein B0H14DRAFT_2646804 [Mycena olivaceomarginata]
MSMGNTTPHCSCLHLGRQRLSWHGRWRHLGVEVVGVVQCVGLWGHFGEKETCWRASARQGHGLLESEEAEEVAEECGEWLQTEWEREGSGALQDCRTQSNWSGLGIESIVCCGAC